MSCGLPNPGAYFTKMFWQLCSVIAVEELPNRNCFRINLVIFLCAMVVHLNNLTSTISAVFFAHTTGKQAEVRANVSKKASVNAVF